MNIPKQLKQSPIVDSICDIRFDSSFPSDIVPGMISSSLNSLNISEIEKLPILNIPESVRNIDPNLLYAPYYKAKIGGITLQFGARMIAISSPTPYIGWEKFLPEIKAIVSNILSSGTITQIKRVAIRTVNFFDVDILENSKVEVSTPILFNKKQYHYTDIYEDNELIIRTTIANNATQHEPTIRIGSVIDIDSYIEKNIIPNVEDILKYVSKTHEEGKNIFFNLLGDEFLKSLEPVYDKS